MTVLRELLHPLVYYLTIKIHLLWKEIVMKHFLKGTAVTVVVMIVLIVINVICNMNGHELDSVSTGVVASVCAMLIYGGLTRNEKNKDEQK